ncbi:MAG TPA: phospho-sugar mutase [Lacipirellulaceae bacterium]|nr:phospho-sugar mutase [Lacipirellulaceae bacterium]
MAYESALADVRAATESGQLTHTALKNIRAWLTESRYAEYAPEVARLIEGRQFKTLDDVFWTVIPFGTGGRRGRMFPVGSNAINDRTIGESAQGLADYVKATLGEAPQGAELSCALAYDTRRRSDHFAKLCAEIMVAAGFRVYLLEGPRSTPELSFCVRYKQCSCGIMVTASHNPPSDNAVKAYWSTGGQLLPPHDAGVISHVMNVDQIDRYPFDEARAAGKVVICTEEVDRAYVAAVAALSTPGPRELKVLYSPLHGVGATAVSPVLAATGFKQVEVFSLHAKQDGDFPNVPGHVSNPENPQVFDSMIAHAAHNGFDLCIATDPDCDRIGLAAPLTASPGAPWRTLNGNQIGALLADYRLETCKARGELGPQKFIVETLVTTQLTRRIADSYGVTTFGDLLVGFKWIAGVIDDEGPENFLYGTEESHGYMAGQHNRDKDGGVAALLACELAAKLKAAGQTLHQKLDALFWQHGVHAERTVSVQMPGSEGMTRMMEVMAQFRSAPPTQLCGSPVVSVRDYFEQLTWAPGGNKSTLAGPRGDLVILDLQLAGNYVAIRPSGTEPKIKLYMFTYEPPEQLANLEDAKGMLEARLSQMEADMRAFAGV